jgi:valyl-tRNA synthetase
MNEKLLKPYNPQETEKRIYEVWEKSGLFNPDVSVQKRYTDPSAKPFTIVMPPPNVTGVLHMGHALMLTLEDIIIRFERMRGKKTLWIPGTDHAAIATQSKVEKDISKKEGLSRHDLGRDELLKRVELFAKESHDTIVSQIKIMGASCDWSREAFTLDEPRTKAVRTMFQKMYEDKLIYRGHRIVNWDPKGQTTISDDEIVYEERKAKLYTFKYSKDFPITISTTRPETKVGDTAVAVHPEDARYKEFVGKEFDFVFCDVPVHIKVVADENVDPDFGTGALGVTPAHSHIDWEIAEKNNLPHPQVINEYAKMTVAGRLEGKKVTEAREIVVTWLKTEGLLEKEEGISQNISTAERTGGIVEPLPKLQWFIDVNKAFTLEHSTLTGIPSGSQTTLKEIMRKVVESKQISIVPEHFDKTYFHWIENLKDWCISRQIWYGHRIPVWYKADEIYCGIEAPEGDDWLQDEDTLDTWFSSGLWTFSTLGWPNETSDLALYHPTDILETGYEILFFWVARMILMSGYALGSIPFHTVYLHGTVRDGQGRKMSKSLGNGIDPIDVANEFGTDAGRMALVVGTGAGTDSKISLEKIKGYKHFCNKLWNITRFILSNTESYPHEKDFSAFTAKDEELRKELDTLLQEVTAELANLKFHLASEKLYHYAWHRLADEIIEDSKTILGNQTPGSAPSEASDGEKKSRAQFLLHTLRTLITALHPFIPFVTEELWSTLPDTKNLLMVEPWPVKENS